MSVLTHNYLPVALGSTKLCCLGVTATMATLTSVLGAYLPSPDTSDFDTTGPDIAPDDLELVTQ